jgi:leucyl aminopeptidase
MTSVTGTFASLTDLTADALVLAVDGAGVPLSHSQFPADALAHLVAPAAALDASGKLGKTTVLPGTVLGEGSGYKRVVLVGIGEGNEADLRFAAGAASRACGNKPGSVVVALPASTDREHSAIAEGALLGAYTFTDYKSEDDKKADAAAEQSEPATPGSDWLIAGASETAIERAKVLAGAVAGVRDMVNTPPLDLYPGSFAEAAQAFGNQLGCTVQVWEPEQLAQQGYGGILAVGMGSSRLPRLVRIAWEPETASQTVALVGKGITFDTGGLSLKTPKPMETMKSDMAGAAAVMHVVLAAARANLPIAVTGWLCLAENMPSGTATRPSDVIRTYSGTTVEVLNTDAEGRLVLADGLARALEENPAVIIDVATLTGAQGMALGTQTSAVMGTDDVRAEVIEAADAAGEAMWPMPLPAHLREPINSKVADLQNMGDPNGGGMLTAGLFLKEFVGDSPWAHLDIARPAFNEGGPYGYTVAGGTGVSVRTLFELLERRANS